MSGSDLAGLRRHIGCNHARILHSGKCHCACTDNIDVVFSRAMLANDSLRKHPAALAHILDLNCRVALAKHLERRFGPRLRRR